MDETGRIMVLAFEKYSLGNYRHQDMFLIAKQNRGYVNVSYLDPDLFFRRIRIRTFWVGSGSDPVRIDYIIKIKEFFWGGEIKEKYISDKKKLILPSI